MNQTLEGHTENIQVITWNESHRKLTTSDQNGVIIVWMIYKNSWYEEMINNRKKSTVVGMAWSSDGLKICIIYADGAVIVGSVDGNRIWGKELKGALLSGVQWSPDGKLLLFALQNGEVHLYDNQGNFMMQLDIQCKSIEEQISIVGLDWYDGKHGYMFHSCATLAICYENGKLQLMTNESNTNIIFVNTALNAVQCRWNHNGSLLAVAGNFTDEEKIVNMIHFYNPLGVHVQTLKVPGCNMSCCEWEGGSLRIALAVDSFVYFANIRPEYKWCYFKRTVVFANNRLQKTGVCVSFWDITNNQCHTRYLPSLIALAGFGDHCVLVTKSDSPESGGKYGLLLCNTLGTPIDGKYIDIKIEWVTINSSLVIAASKDYFLLWHYRTPKTSNVGISGNRGKHRLYHIDDSSSGAVEVIQEFEEVIEEPVTSQSSLNPICCLSASDRCLVVGRENGLFQHYALPHVVLINKYKINSRPKMISINCNSSRLAVIDINGVLNMIELTDNISRLPSSKNECNKLERRDVWAMCWASDNPQLLAIMEKTRMYVFKGIYPEEPMASAGYICCFQDLEIQAILLDDLMDSPDRPSKDHIISLEVKSLRDTRQLLEKVGISEAAQFIEENPHPRLWRLLAEAAVKKINLSIAESAFIRSLDYAGIQFIKKLQGITCEQLKKAVIATYFKQYDESEKLFLDSDRRDLALIVRQTLGDWFRVVQLMKMGIRGTDVQMENAWNSIGHYFYNRQNWDGAREYFEKSHNVDMLIQCYYAQEDYEALESLISVLSERYPMLQKMAEMFISIGLCSVAVKTFIKFGDIHSAVNFCVKLNEWDQAISLAKQGNLPQISELLDKYGMYLMSKNNHKEAVELYLKANRFFEAAKIVYHFAKIEAKTRTDLLKVKKLYVYAALLIEEHLKLMNSAFKDNTLTGDFSELDIIKSPWHGAEGYHLLMLAHAYLYKGQPYNAMVLALVLREYDDVINAEEISCLLAICSCLNNCFGICSRAFIKLESLEEISNNGKHEYENLAVDIFTKFGLKDHYMNRIDCFNCGTLISEWNYTCSTCYTEFPTCMVSGKPLTDMSCMWTCTVCKHSASEKEVSFLKNCALCHSIISN